MEEHDPKFPLNDQSSRTEVARDVKPDFVLDQVLLRAEQSQDQDRRVDLERGEEKRRLDHQEAVVS